MTKTPNLDNLDLVNPKDYGIKADKIYYFREDIRKKFDIGIKELELIGIRDGDILICSKIIKPLLKAREELMQHGLEIIIKDGYRSPELYKLAYQKRVAKEGSIITDKLFNLAEMPHKSGLVVDLGLLDSQSQEPVMFFNYNADGAEAWFIDFYKHKKDLESQKFQKVQDLLISTMIKCGFELGSKREVWHFDFVI